MSRGKTAAQTDDATRRDGLTTHASGGRRWRSPFVYPPCRPSCQSRNSVTDAHTTDVYPLVVDDVHVVSRRQRGPCEMLQSSLISRRESRPAAGRAHPLPPLAVVVPLALDIRTTAATYAADDSSLLFQASRGSGSESTSASRWTLSRAIVQSSAEIISASARFNRLSPWTPRDFRE